MAPAFEAILLGTGSPMPSPDRCGAGTVVLTPDARILVDCGWGAARRLFAAGVLPQTIDALYITHLHSDHITDIPDFLIMRWTMSVGAVKPLAVYGPEGTQRMIDGFLAALADDIRFRVAHHAPKLREEGVRCVVQEIPATPDRTRVGEHAGITVDAFEVDHFPVVPALGFRLDHDGHAVVISGDTKRCDSLVRAARGADMLICEAANLPLLNAMITNVRANNPGTASLLDDVADYHTSTLDVAAMARDAGVKHLVLSHLLPPVPPGQPAVLQAFTAGMSDVYSGKITVGHDLLRLPVGEA